MATTEGFYLPRVLPDDQKNALLAKAARAYNGQNNIATLLERGAWTEINVLLTETKDRIQAGIVNTLKSLGAVASPALPALKALNSADPQIVAAIAEIETKVAAATEKKQP